MARSGKARIWDGGDTADGLRSNFTSSKRFARVICAYRRDEENMPGSRREVKMPKKKA